MEKKKTRRFLGGKKRGPKKGYHHSKATKEKISKSNVGKKLSKDHKKEISKRMRGAKNPSFNPFTIEVVIPKEEGKDEVKSYDFDGRDGKGSPLEQAKSDLGLTQTMVYKMKNGYTWVVDHSSATTKRNGWPKGTKVSYKKLKGKSLMDYVKENTSLLEYSHSDPMMNANSVSAKKSGKSLMSMDRKHLNLLKKEYQAKNPIVDSVMKTKGERAIGGQVLDNLLKDYGMEFEEGVLRGLGNGVKLFTYTNSVNKKMGVVLHRSKEDRYLHHPRRKEEDKKKD